MHDSYWRTMRTWFSVAALLCLSVSALASAAQAQSEPAPYRDTVREALSEYHAKNFPEARVLFTEAHRLFPNARTLRGLGMTAFELRDYQESIQYLNEALSSQVKPLEGSLRAETERLLARAERFVGKLNLSVTPSGAEVLLDGTPVQHTEGKPLIMQVGDHSLEFRADGYASETRSLNVKGREVETWSVVLNKNPPPPPPVAEAPDEVPAPAEVAARAEEPQGPRYFNLQDQQERPTKRPVYKSPWLWTGVGVAVVAIVVTSVVLATRDPELAGPEVSDHTPVGGQFSALVGQP